MNSALQLYTALLLLSIPDLRYGFLNSEALYENVVLHQVNF